MQNEPNAIAIDLSPTFQRDLSDLSKHYRHIRSDIQPLIDQLYQGETPGDRIQGTKSMVYKVRLKNSDIQRGKSRGYRAIYYLKTRKNFYSSPSTPSPIEATLRLKRL
jgi:mRNA-degrading endonuclease RelE of RelBE toxin-antitoxin system